LLLAHQRLHWIGCRTKWRRAQACLIGRPHFASWILNDDRTAAHRSRRGLSRLLSQRCRNLHRCNGMGLLALLGQRRYLQRGNDRINSAPVLFGYAALRPPVPWQEGPTLIRSAGMRQPEIRR
jgi:hypothetical protein